MNRAIDQYRGRIAALTTVIMNCQNTIEDCQKMIIELEKIDKQKKIKKR